MGTIKYTIGIDFGTESGRALLVNVANGEEVATAVHPYAHGGGRHLENLVTACQPCNLIKGKRPFASLEDARNYVVARREEWRQRYQENMSRL